ncbi:hypothetical protein LCGC14_0698770 [marine sediment metagenome]|uniref:dTMP kinase n=1 Tax=marine sediment metagenome TaxID=412755 RepID=A0A0F9TR61_9ZZZZ
MSNSIIAIEGINGVGKTEVIRNCRVHLQDSTRDFWFGHEMQDGVGAAFQQLMRRGAELPPQALALMFAACRLDSHQRRCTDQEPGTVLVYDRFLWSSLAYHSVRCDPLWVQGINQQSPRADLNILLDADPEELSKRTANTKFIGTFPVDLEFRRQVRNNFLDLAKQNPGHAVAVDAMQQPGEMAQQVVAEIRGFLAKTV